MEKPETSFGVIADPQFADKDTSRNRYFRMSLEKLEEAIEYFNSRKPDFVMVMGDLIDVGFSNFSKPLEIINRCECPVRMIIGNHDYNVAQNHLEEVPLLIGVPERYYSFRQNNWRFIVLDGNEISLFANPPGSMEYAQAEKIHETMLENKAENAFKWNGAIGPAQLGWLEMELDDAEKNEEEVIVCSHYPVYPPDYHNLWNDNEVLSVLDKSSRVRAFLSGHNHHGNYGCRNGVQFVSFSGMVDFRDNTFAYVEIYQNRMQVKGFGRESDRTLSL